MTKRQAERYWNLKSTFGDKLDALLRIEKNLHTWAEMECNGDIERDEKTGKVYWSRHGERGSQRRDTETGALKRLEKILSGTIWSFYNQTDPRGCALYLYEASKLNGKEINRVYSQIGIAICI